MMRTAIAILLALWVILFAVPSRAADAYWYADAAAGAGGDGKDSVGLGAAYGGTWTTTDGGTTGTLAKVGTLAGVTLDDHIYLDDGATQGWYYPTSLSGAPDSITLAYLHGTKVVGSPVNSSAGPFDTWADIGGSAGVGGAWDDDDTAWMVPGTYNLGNLRFASGVDYGDRVIRRLGTGTVELTNTSNVILIQMHATAAAATGSLTVQDCTISAGAYAGNYPIYNEASVDFSFAFVNCIFDAEDRTPQSWIRCDATGAATRDLTVQDCTFRDMAATYWLVRVARMDQVSVTGCVVEETATYSEARFVYTSSHVNYLEVSGNGTADTPVALTGASSRFVGASGAMEKLETPTIILADNYCEASSLFSLTKGPANPDMKPDVAILRNAFTRTAAGTGTGLLLGMDRPNQGGDEYSDYPLGSVAVIGNVMAEPAGGSDACAHMLEIGFGADGALVSDNLVFAPKDCAAGLDSYGFVIKGNGANILNNRVYGSNCIYMIGGANGIVRGNSVVATLHYALCVNDQPPDAGGTGTATGGSTSTLETDAEARADDYFNAYELIVTHAATGLVETREIIDYDEDATDTFTVSPDFSETCAASDTYLVRTVATGTRVIGNILQADGAGVVCLQLGGSSAVQAATAASLVMDYTLYDLSGGATNVATIVGDTNYASLAALQAAWAADYDGSLAAMNDQHSVEVEPRFVRVAGVVATDDWRLRENSPAISLNVTGGPLGAMPIAVRARGTWGFPWR